MSKIDYSMARRAILTVTLSLVILGLPAAYAVDDCQAVAACTIAPPVNSITPSPKADLVLLQDPTYNSLSQKSLDALASYTVSGLAGDVKSATGTADAITKITDKFNTLSRPVEVIISGHGAAGYQEVGDSGTAGNFLTDTNAAVTSFTSQLKGKVSSVHFLGCSVGNGVTGAAFLQKIADGLGPGVVVDGYTDCIYPAGNAKCNFNSNKLWCTPGTLVSKSGAISRVPEFGTEIGLLVAVSAMALLMLRRQIIKPISQNS